MQPDGYQPNINQVQAAPPTPQPIPNGIPMPQATILDYVSNPFLVGLRSLIDTLKTNPVAVLLTPLVLFGSILVLGIVVGILSITKTSAGSILALLIILAAYLIAVPVMLGMYYTIAAQSSRGQKISTKEAYSHGLKKALPMLGLLVVSTLLTLLGLILLVIPGIIFAVRASLAPAIMYSEDLGVFASIGRSFALTKGHFVETLAAIIAGGIFGTNGILAPYFGVTQLVGRYHDYKALQESGAAKPQVHWLNYLIVLIIPVAIALYVGIFALAFQNAQNKSKDIQIKTQQNINNSFYKYDSYDY